MISPQINRDWDKLNPELARRLRRVFAAMEAKGYDPMLFEGLRTQERQRWLYGIGRTHRKWQKPVTWTLKSKHLVGKAADIVSKKRLWNWPEFYKELRQQAKEYGLRTLRAEACHVEI